MPASSPALWLYDPEGRWPDVVGRCVPADARVVDGRCVDRIAALAEDGAPAPVVALVDDDAAALAALTAGADEVLTRSELEHLPARIARAAARRRVAARRIARRAAEVRVIDGTLESFGRAVSHDLRAPLRAIDGFGQALVEDVGDVLDPDARLYLGRIRAATGRLDARMMALVRLTQMVRRPFEAEPVDLGALADEADEELREAAPERDVRWRRAPDLRVIGDRRLLRALVGELMANAWRFSAPRTTAHVALRRAGGGFVLRDDGVGFGPTYADSIFNAFVRYHTDAEFPGQGVGLAVVRCAVERHGGRIHAWGVEGQGAAFGFTLDPEAALPDVGPPGGDRP